MTWLNRRRAWELGLIAFAGGVVGFLPAQLFQDRINQALPPPWQAAMTGTILSGTGVLQGGQAGGSFSVPLNWSFDPAALIRLRVGWKIVAASPALSGSVKIGAGWQSVEFREAALTMDAAALQQAIPIVALFGPTGILFVSTPAESRLTVGYGNAPRVSGEAQIKADNFGLRSISPQPLGNYQLKITARESTINYAVTQSRGALMLDGGGSIQIAAPRRIVYAGNAAPSPALPDNVRAQLASVGRPAADGRLRIDWQAPW